MPTTFSLTLKTEGLGNVSPDSGNFSPNTTISLTAMASEGYYFDRWEGTISSEENPYTLGLAADHTIRAVFLPLPELAEEILVYDPKRIDSNSVFMIVNGGKKAFLVDKTGRIENEWTFENALGNDLELFSDGTLMGIFKPEKTAFTYGGYGGLLRKFDATGNLIWEYERNTENELLHHDFTLLPNGNILTLVWERIPTEQAVLGGINTDQDVFLEKIIEIHPESKTIVWEWRSWQHLIQDRNPAASNFGVVQENPQKIDPNYPLPDNGDLMHANGLTYDAENDLIYLSVNFYSEVWVIDHSKSTQELEGTMGDLRYRFGNPRAYQGTGTRLFFNNHHPNFVRLDPNTFGHFMIFMNGSKEQQSIVYEMEIPQPDRFINAGELTPPSIHWEFSDPDLFFGKISGAIRLPNGNTLICEGDFGYWEVSPEKEVVWKYAGKNMTFWRGYVYPF